MGIRTPIFPMVTCLSPLPKETDFDIVGGVKVVLVDRAEGRSSTYENLLP